MDLQTRHTRQQLMGLLADALPLVDDPDLSRQLAAAGTQTAEHELLELVRRSRFHVSRGDMEGHLLARFDRALFG